MTLTPSSSKSSLSTASEAPESPKPVLAAEPKKRYNLITKPPVPKASSRQTHSLACQPSATFITQTVFEEHHPAKRIATLKPSITNPESTMPASDRECQELLLQIRKYKQTAMAIIGANWPYVVPQG